MSVRWLRLVQRDRTQQIDFIAAANPCAALEAGDTVGRAQRLVEFPLGADRPDSIGLNVVRL